jgi:murein DD-endopeptidase MepM/ murein hydrolase activator NlpD
MFIYPCKGRLTSPFGKDVLQGAVRWHNGIDLAQGGTVEIVAAADGVVSLSYLSSSYGECVRVVHNINGQTYETLYAHMRSGSRKVRNGDKVKQGQVLGYMGSTGVSTGQHLHFELHKGTWNSQKSNAVDPLLYLGKDTATVHVVKSGDTLWGISKANGMTVSQLKGINNLKSDVIHPGDKLKLKRSAAPDESYIKIVNVKARAIIQDQPDRKVSKTLGYIDKGKTIPITGSVRGENSDSGYWEVKYKDGLGYITGEFGEYHK